MTTAAVVIIGNEILSGKVQDTNTPRLIAMLREAGVSLRRVVVIGDQVETISAEVLASAEAHDHVFTSGGVGPTHDDLTMAGLAHAFDVPVVSHPVLEQMVRAHWGERVNSAALKLAEVPQGATVQCAQDGHLPAICFHNIFILPGVPQIFAAKLKAIRPLLTGLRPALKSVFLSVDESSVAAQLSQVVQRFPTVEIGSYPRLDDPDHRVRVTLEGPDPKLVDQAVEALLALLPPDGVLRVE